jgi:putative protein-disulfide isomerase
MSKPDNPASPAIPVTYLFDPLCGWCYGAAPMLQRLQTVPGLAVDLAPTGLFSGGSRTMDANFAAYAWSNDQRIAKLSGQAFTPAYREKVLGAVGAPFDSGPATRALTAVWLEQPAMEAEALRAIQSARYVDGRNVMATAELIDILKGIGLNAAADRFQAGGERLTAAVTDRVGAAQTQMASLQIQGVPALVASSDGQRRAISASALFGPLEALLATLGVPQSPMV